MFRKFALFLAAVFVVCAVMFLVVAIWTNPAEGSLGFEVASVLLQVGVVSVAGAFISMLAFEYQQERQRSDQERDLERRKLEYRERLLKDTLNQATVSYYSVKKARRLLKARAITQEHGSDPERVLGKEYDRYMEVVNDAQLSLEQVAGDVDTSKPAFTQPEPLVNYLRSMERYLERLIDEYEHSLRTFTGEPPSKDRSSLTRLSDFLGPSRPSEFRTQVIDPYHAIQKLIRSDLLHPELPTVSTDKIGD